MTLSERILMLLDSSAGWLFASEIEGVLEAERNKLNERLVYLHRRGRLERKKLPTNPTRGPRYAYGYRRLTEFREGDDESDI